MGRERGEERLWGRSSSCPPGGCQHPTPQRCNPRCPGQDPRVTPFAGVSAGGGQGRGAPPLKPTLRSPWKQCNVDSPESEWEEALAAACRLTPIPWGPISRTPSSSRPGTPPHTPSLGLLTRSPSVRSRAGVGAAPPCSRAPGSLPAAPHWPGPGPPTPRSCSGPDAGSGAADVRCSGWGGGREPQPRPRAPGAGGANAQGREAKPELLGCRRGRHPHPPAVGTGGSSKQRCWLRTLPRPGRPPGGPLLCRSGLHPWEPIWGVLGGRARICSLPAHPNQTGPGTALTREGGRLASESWTGMLVSPFPLGQILSLRRDIIIVIE